MDSYDMMKTLSRPFSQHQDPKRVSPVGKPGLDLLDEDEVKAKRPSMWNIVFYNDDYTPMDFVEFILKAVFHMSTLDALALTLAIHTQGKGIAGTYTFEVAEQKQCEVLLIAKIEEHPLRFEVDCGHLGVRDDNAARVLASSEFAAHGEAGFGGAGRDQFDDDPVADERLGAPVPADEGEEPVFDFVPLAGAGRQVADHNIEAEFVGQLLQFAFPQPHPRAVAAAAVRGDQQSGGLGIARPTDSTPPLSDAIDGERSRVMVNADTHPTRIGSEVIDPVGHRPSQFLD